MGAERGRHHTTDVAALDDVVTRLRAVGQIDALAQLLAAHVAARGGAGELLIEIRIRTQGLHVAEPISAIDVQQCHVQMQRRHRQQQLRVRVRRTHRAKLRIHGHDIGGQTHAGWQEWHAHSRGAQSPLQQPLIQFARLDAAGLARTAEPGFHRNRIEGYEAVDEFPDLARRTQHADLGAAVGDEGELLERGAQDLAHQMHGFAPRPPATDADRHAVAQGSDHRGSRERLVEHCRWLQDGGGGDQRCPHRSPMRLWVGTQLLQSGCRPWQPNSRSNPPGVCT